MKKRVILAPAAALIMGTASTAMADIRLLNNKVEIDEALKELAVPTKMRLALPLTSNPSVAAWIPRLL